MNIDKSLKVKKGIKLILKSCEYGNIVIDKDGEIVFKLSTGHSKSLSKLKNTTSQYLKYNKIDYNGTTIQYFPIINKIIIGSYLKILNSNAILYVSRKKESEFVRIITKDNDIPIVSIKNRDIQINTLYSLALNDFKLYALRNYSHLEKIKAIYLLININKKEYVILDKESNIGKTYFGVNITQTGVYDFIYTDSTEDKLIDYIYEKGKRYILDIC